MKRFQVQLADRKWFKENVGCENACPVNTRAPQYISAIRKGNYAVAFELTRYSEVFPRNTIFQIEIKSSE